MTDEMLSLARRAVACPAWRWRPGMIMRRRHESWSWLVFHADEQEVRIIQGGLLEWWGVDQGHFFPDLADPGTLGHLLALVREAWGDPGASISGYVVDGEEEGTTRMEWCCDIGVRPTERLDSFYGQTEAEALVYALEAAP